MKADQWVLQVVLARLQVASGSHAGIHLGTTDISCHYSRSIYTSCSNLVMPQTRWWIGDRAFSVVALRAWNRLPTELKLLRSTDSFHHDMKTFLFHSVYRHQDTDWLCDAPSVF